MRRTKALVAVAVALTNKPDEKRWGYELSREAGLRSGVIYPLLNRLVEEGWLTDGWEDPTTIERKRPPRRYYQLTEIGAAELAGIAKSVAHEHRGATRPARWREA